MIEPVFENLSDFFVLEKEQRSQEVFWVFVIFLFPFLCFLSQVLLSCPTSDMFPVQVWDNTIVTHI